MEIKVDLDRLIELELSPTEFCILKLLYDKEYKILEGMTSSSQLEWTNDTTFLGTLQHLEYRGWIKITQYGDFKFSDIILRRKAENLFEVDTTNLYLKLWTIFPCKVPDGNGGYRVLKAKNSDSEDFKKGLQLWNSIVKKEDNPEIIIKALEKQLELTRAKLQYTQNFLTWLRQKTYQKYVDLLDISKPDTTTESI